MGLPESYWIVYPGQPFIEDGIINTLLSFANEPNDDGLVSPNERSCAQKAVANIMVATESIIKQGLHKIDAEEPYERIEILKSIIQNNDELEKGLTLWNELSILRNDIIHTGYFINSNEISDVSKATAKRIHSKNVSKFLKSGEHETRKWGLTINPLRTTRYEAIVALTFFWWLGNKSGIWKSGVPFDSASVDCRLKPIYNSNWMNRKSYHSLLNVSGDMDFFLAYLHARLPEERRRLYLKNTFSLFDSDYNSIYKLINNSKPSFHLK